MPKSPVRPPRRLMDIGSYPACDRSCAFPLLDKIHRAAYRNRNCTNKPKLMRCTKLNQGDNCTRETIAMRYTILVLWRVFLESLGSSAEPVTTFCKFLFPFASST